MKRFCCLLVAVVLAVMMPGCAGNAVDADSSGTVVYDRYEISFEDELTGEEVQAVAEILNGKLPVPAVLGRPSCGFDENVAIIIDGRRYALACDGCGTVQDMGALGYIHISDAEQDVLEKIFTSRGGVFPCV